MSFHSLPCYFSSISSAAKHYNHFSQPTHHPRFLTPWSSLIHSLHQEKTRNASPLWHHLISISAILLLHPFPLLSRMTSLLPPVTTTQRVKVHRNLPATQQPKRTCTDYSSWNQTLNWIWIRVKNSSTNKSKTFFRSITTSQSSCTSATTMVGVPDNGMGVVQRRLMFGDKYILVDENDHVVDHELEYNCHLMEKIEKKICSTELSVFSYLTQSTNYSFSKNLLQR